jgi:hypothetical protein
MTDALIRGGGIWQRLSPLVGLGLAWDDPFD